METKEILRLLDKFLKEETVGLAKGFDKNALIFSYNDIKYDLGRKIKESRSPTRTVRRPSGGSVRRRSRR